MKELFLPYELAKLLSKKQFDAPCIAKYTYDKKQNISWLSIKEQSIDFILDQQLYGKLVNYNTPIYKSEGSISAPLYQQVIDWLDKKEIFVEYTLDLSNGLFEYYGEIYVIIDYNKTSTYKSNPQPTKIKALTLAIEAALKLIP